MEILFAFKSTNHAIRAEQLLLQVGIGVKVMPLPSAILAGCGICLRILPDAYKVAMAVLCGETICVQGTYTRSVEHGKSVYMPYTVECE